jgi:hypothetical protein
MLDLGGDPGAPEPRRSFTSRSANAGQSTSGKATWWALKFPVAPPNFAAKGTASASASAFSSRSTNTASSLPRRVGEAGCPWVRASMGTSAQASARSRRSSSTAPSAGPMDPSQASLRDRGTAVLLMSWEVSPKWMNSRNADRPSRSKASLRKYSTALTSWLVVRSISFTRRASSMEKSRYILRRSSNRPGSRAARGGRGSSRRAMKYSTSTRTR